MYTGVGPTRFTWRGIILVALYSVAIVVCMSAYFVFGQTKVRADKKKIALDADNVKLASRAGSSIDPMRV